MNKYVGLCADLDSWTVQRASASLGYPVSNELSDYSLSLVRSVAPKKDMYRLSFRLPKEVAFKGARSEGQ